MTVARALPAAMVLALITLGPAASEPSPSTKLCNPDAMQTNDYAACLEKALADAERKVYAITSKVVALIAAGELDAGEHAKTKTLLETAQGEWRKFRDAECAAYARHTGGLGFGAAQFRLACLVDETMLRADALKSRYELAD